MRSCFRAGRLVGAAAPLFALTLGVASFAGAQPPASPTPTAPVVAAPAVAAPGQVVARAAWDDRYLYFAVQVDDTNITGTNTRPLSPVEQDDSVAVYFQTGTDRPDAPNAQTHAMIVSVAGGFTFQDGDAQIKALVPHPLYTIKYGVSLQGTLNRPDDRDKGYWITLAVPLAALNLDPKTLKPGDGIGFNLVVRSREGGGFTSLSPDVKTAADIAVPARWERLVLAGGDGKTGERNVAGGVIATRVPAPSLPKEQAHPPSIDGVFRPDEWNGAASVAFASPDKPRAQIVVAAPVVGVAADFTKEDSTPPTLDLTQPLTDIQRLLMARYIPTYQGDAHRVTMPRRGIFAPDNTLLLTDQPITGVGPWFSSERTSWHRGEFAAMRKAGIDVALVQVGGPDAAGPDAPLGPMDEKALLVMVSALRDMTRDKVPAPQTALYLDTTALAAPNTPAPDLPTPAGRDILYAAIRRWMRLVPPEFCARVALPPNAAGGRIVSAFPVFLSNASALAGVSDGAWVDDIRARFAAEFGPATTGATLLFVGVGPGWEGASGKMGATVSAGVGKGGGAISTFAIQPGMETLTGTLIPRKAGETYRAAWDAALAANASWIVLDSWNDFGRGTDVAPSRQGGFRYSDLTRIYAIQQGGLKPKQARWLTQDAPRRMFPGQVATTIITVQNTGSLPFGGEDGVAVVYRWRDRNGQIVAQNPVRLPLAVGLLPTQQTRISVGIVAAQLSKDGQLIPLPTGEYTVEVDLAETSGEASAPKVAWFSDDISAGSPPLRLPVTVLPDAGEQVEIESTSLPALVVGGGKYPVSVRLRWLSPQPLPLDAASLTYVIQTEDGKTTVKSGSFTLPSALPPGQWVDVDGTIEMSEATLPVPPAFPEQRPSGAAGGYRIRWILTRNNSVAPIRGEYANQVAIYLPDEQVQILPPAPFTSPQDAGSTLPMEVTVFNRGTTKWAKGAFAVGYHWFDPDGLDAAYRPAVTTALPDDLLPGESRKVTVNVRTPDHAGDYVLAFDALKLPDTYLSTRPATLASDLAVLPVRVEGGRLTFADLSRLFDTSAIASEENPGAGNLDGAGGAFPAESFPPDRFGIVAYLTPPPADSKAAPKPKDEAAYPSAFYSEGATGARQISFKYGPDSDGGKNAVACAGQTIEVKAGRYFGLHLAATATGGMERSLTLTLRYRDGTTQTVTRTVADWNHAPEGKGDPIAVSTRRKRGANGDTVAFCAVRHIIVPVDITRDLVGIVLPQEAHIKVFAATLEK